MIRHRIIWKLKEDMSEVEKQEVRMQAKKHLEALRGKIDGLITLSVIIDPLPTSNGDMMLDSLFDSVEALKGYASHPLHLAVANTYVRPYTASRACIDYEAEE